MKSKFLLPLALFGVLIFGAPVQAQTIYNSATFDGTWTQVSGTGGIGPSGAPSDANIIVTNSYSPGVTQIAGIAAGSAYAALINSGTTSPLNLVPIAANRVQNFQLSFDLAVSSNSSTTGSRLANMTLIQAGSSATAINLAVFSTQGNANTAGLYIHNGSAWVSVATGVAVTGTNYLANDILTSGAFNTATDTFANLNTYKITLTMNGLGVGQSYSISYGLEGGSMTTYNGSLTSSATLNSTGGLNQIAFASTWSGASTATPYAIDNLLYTSVPEPSTIAMAFAGFMLLGGKMMRRSRSTI